jgi:hypothetical protein
MRDAALGGVAGDRDGRRRRGEVDHRLRPGQRRGGIVLHRHP